MVSQTQLKSVDADADRTLSIRTLLGFQIGPMFLPTSYKRENHILTSSQSELGGNFLLEVRTKLQNQYMTKEAFLNFQSRNVFVIFFL